MRGNSAGRRHAGLLGRQDALLGDDGVRGNSAGRRHAGLLGWQDALLGDEVRGNSAGRILIVVRGNSAERILIN